MHTADGFVMNMANMGCMGMCRMEGMLNKVRMKTAVRLSLIHI